MINLLPPEEKNRLLEERQQRIAIILGIIVFVFLISLYLVLSIVNLQIKSRAEAYSILLESAKKELEVSGAADLQKKLEAYNKKLIIVRKLYLQEKQINGLIERLAKAVPSGLYLTSFSYNKDTSQVQLSGFAPRREILFTFKGNLEKIKDFTEVVFPPSNWVKPVDIDFSATLKLSPNP